jgi:hypothetical protein
MYKIGSADYEISRYKIGSADYEIGRYNIGLADSLTNSSTITVAWA